MNTKQMVRFLLSEGWKRNGDLWNESKFLDARWGHGLSDAYSIAVRRKDQRDTRRLKKAGAEFVEFVLSDGGDPYKGWCIGSRFIGYTKAEALATLGEV